MKVDDPMNQKAFGCKDAPSDDNRLRHGGKPLLALLLCLLPFAASAEWGKFESEFEGEKPWAEIEAQLPPYPREENLLPFYVSAMTENRFFVDAASLGIGKDGVVRYTLVVKSAAGALNVSFEGIRCASQESKLYTFGRSGGTWSRARAVKWQPIEYKERNRHHHVLYDDFFCPRGIIVRDAKEAIDALKRGSHPAADPASRL